MRILVFHGYLLGGTGSNVYNARLAAAFVAQGHEVHLLCQDRHPESQAFVDAVGDWDGGELRVRDVRERGAAGPGSCTVYRPDIGDLLPVYVADRYEGIEARTFAECSDEQIARLRRGQRRRRERAGRAASRPDVALANHLVMGPAILARALGGRVPYAVKVHGSALEYTVKPDRERFLPFAREGLAQAGGVLVGSHHTAASLWGALGDPRAAGAHAPGPARRGRRALRAARAGRGGRGGLPRSPRACAARRRGAGGAAADGERVRARRARRGRGAGAAGPRARPAGGVRRQADRQQGRRPAARGVAAGARAGARRAAGGRRLRRLPRRRWSACSPRSPPAT